MRTYSLLVSLTLATMIAACGGSSEEHGHEHDGAPANQPEEDAGGDEHAHDEDSLGTLTIGDLELELTQGHGAVAAGKEAHLVVRLPYSDDGSTIVRAWIGGEDRTLSYVGKAEYDAEHGDYNVHATAPDPLPADARWWIELEQPGGAKLVGSVKPIVE